MRFVKSVHWWMWMPFSVFCGHRFANWIIESDNLGEYWIRNIFGLINAFYSIVLLGIIYKLI